MDIKTSKMLFKSVYQKKYLISKRMKGIHQQRAVRYVLSESDPHRTIPQEPSFYFKWPIASRIVSCTQTHLPLPWENIVNMFIQ